MPELPEVETIRRDLSAVLVGRRIEGVTLRRSDILRRTTPEEAAERLTGREVTGARRRGKNLIIDLSGDRVLLVNLGMTGQLYVRAADAEAAEHTHLTAVLSDGRRLFYRDVRRFGHLELCAGDELAESFTLRNVGVDAMSEELTPRRLAELLDGRTAPIKNALLNQSLVAGLGNIYASEVLYRARIDPRAGCDELGWARIEVLHGAMRAVLGEAIAAEGTTISDYVTGSGVPGGFQRRLRVYGREGEVCRAADCEQVIERIVQCGRCTFLCPGCQTR